MDSWLAWGAVGLALVIVELLTGTFYLLMLGVAAFGAAGAAALGYDFPVQAIVAAVLAAGGCYGVHIYPAKNPAGQKAPIDAGQAAELGRGAGGGAPPPPLPYPGAA